MGTQNKDSVGFGEPSAELEMALIHEYLARQQRRMRSPTPEQIEQVWKDALLYASLQLEIGHARAHLWDSLH